MCSLPRSPLGPVTVTCASIVSERRSQTAGPEMRSPGTNRASWKTSLTGEWAKYLPLVVKLPAQPVAAARVHQLPPRETVSHGRHGGPRCAPPVHGARAARRRGRRQRPREGRCDVHLLDPGGAACVACVERGQETADDLGHAEVEVVERRDVPGVVHGDHRGVREERGRPLRILQRRREIEVAVHHQHRHVGSRAPAGTGGSAGNGSGQSRHPRTSWFSSCDRQPRILQRSAETSPAARGWHPRAGAAARPAVPSDPRSPGSHGRPRRRMRPRSTGSPRRSRRRRRSRRPAAAAARGRLLRTTGRLPAGRGRCRGS